LLQAQSTRQQILIVNLEFTKLARAMVEDIGIQNFHDLDRVREQLIGPSTKRWLKEARPVLHNVYSFFGDRIEMILNPSGEITPDN